MGSVNDLPAVRDGVCWGAGAGVHLHEVGARTIVLARLCPTH